MLSVEKQRIRKRANTEFRHVRSTVPGLRTDNAASYGLASEPLRLPSTVGEPASCRLKADSRIAVFSG